MIAQDNHGDSFSVLSFVWTICYRSIGAYFALAIGIAFIEASWYIFKSPVRWFRYVRENRRGIVAGLFGERFPDEDIPSTTTVVHTATSSEASETSEKKDQ